MYRVVISIPEGTMMAGHPAPAEMAFRLRTDDAQYAQQKGERVAETIKGGLYPKNAVLTVSVTEVQA